MLPQAQRPSAKTNPFTFDQDMSGMLSPAGAKHRHPLGRVERADGQPTHHGNRIGLLNERFQSIDRRGEA